MFGKKKKVVEAPVVVKPLVEEPKCKHHWRDFHWYMVPHWYKDKHKTVIDIYEPYVCIHCKERQDKLLERVVTYEVDTVEAYGEALQNMYDTYKELAPRAMVENSILDMQLVDRQYLHLSEQLGYTPRTVGDVLKNGIKTTSF